MVIKELVKLADSLDKKGEKKMANLVDSIIRKYADADPEEEAAAGPHDEMAEHAETEEHDEEDHEEAAEGDEVPEEAPAAPAEGGEDMDAMYAEQGGPGDEGPLGKNWAGGQPLIQWDLTPVSQGEFAGTMVDKRQPLPTDAAPAAAPVAAPEADADGEEAEGEEAPEESDEMEEGDEMTQEAALKLAELANGLDKKGFTKEADMIDEILADIKKGA